MRKVCLIILLGISLGASAQTVKVIEGNLNQMKGERSINIEFTYDDMTVGDDQLKEADYVAKKKKEFDTKDPGRGDKWTKAWRDDRKNRFEPKFIELFEKYSKMDTKANSQYTLIFNTTRTEPGWVGVGIFRKSARIDGEATIVETKNRKTVIAKMLVTNAPGAGGMGYDYDTGLRIQEAYAKSGKEIGKVVGKKK